MKRPAGCDKGVDKRDCYLFSFTLELDVSQQFLSLTVLLVAIYPMPLAAQVRVVPREEWGQRTQPNRAALPPKSTEDEIALKRRKWATLNQDQIPLHEAVAVGLVHVRITGLGGSSGDALEIRIRRAEPAPMNIVLEPGTIFFSRNPSVQDMAGVTIRGERVATGDPRFQFSTELVATAIIDLDDDDEHTYLVEAYCLDFHKRNPSALDTFAIGKPDQGVTTFLKLGKEAGYNVKVLQTALWLARNPRDAREIPTRFRISHSELVEAAEFVDGLKHGNRVTAGARDESRRTEDYGLVGALPTRASDRESVETMVQPREQRGPQSFGTDRTRGFGRDR